MSTPGINFKRLRSLANELKNRWQELQAFYLDASAGFHLVRKAADEERGAILSLGADDHLDPADFVDTVQWSYERIFEAPFCTSGMHEAKIGAVRKRNAPDGHNFVELGRLLVVSLYSFWDEYFRREYVIAKGQLDPMERDQKAIRQALAAHASFDLWGDIRLLRQDIVHNRGIASGANVGRCRLIKWFRVGDRIAITPPEVRMILLAVYKFHNDVHAESFPPHYITVPRRSQ